MQVNICPLWRESFNHRNSLGMTVSAFGMGKNLSHLLSNCEVFCEIQFGRLQLTRLTTNKQTNNCLPSSLEAKRKSCLGGEREGVVVDLSRLDGILTKKKNNNSTDGFSLWIGHSRLVLEGQATALSCTILVARQETSKFSNMGKLKKRI